MTAPKPRDPNALPTPEYVDTLVGDILAEPAASLREEATQLDRAHDVLRQVLQEN